MVGLLRPARGRQHPVFKEEAPFRASERVFIGRSEPAAPEHLAAMRGALDVVATVLAHTHPNMIAQPAAGRGRDIGGQTALAAASRPAYTAAPQRQDLENEPGRHREGDSYGQQDRRSHVRAGAGERSDRAVGQNRDSHHPRRGLPGGRLPHNLKLVLARRGGRDYHGRIEGPVAFDDGRADDDPLGGLEDDLDPGLGPEPGPRKPYQLALAQSGRG